MSFQATVDMFINFSCIQVRFLNKLGFIRYRVKIYMKHDQQKQAQIVCIPYNIVRSKTKVYDKFALEEQDVSMESEIDNDGLYYYSRYIPVICRSGTYQQNETVFFKSFINTQLTSKLQYYCLIQCLFTQNLNMPPQILSKFQARLHRYHDLSTFLPASFDAFQGFLILATFHSTILEFRYQEDDNQGLISEKNSFQGFLNSVTGQFERKELSRFYNYYREFLSKQFKSIQNRHQQLTNKLIKQSKSKYQQNQIKKIPVSSTNITKNTEILSLIGKQSGDLSPIRKQTQHLIAELIAKDLASMKSHIYSKWMQFANLVISFSKNIAKLYRKQYQELCKERFKSNVFSHRIRNHDWRVARYEDSNYLNLQHASNEKRKLIGEEDLWKDSFPIQNVQFFGKTQTNIKIFQQIYQTNKHPIHSSTQTKKKHIIFLVHGFQASRQDFILFKNCLQVVYGVQVVISTCNQGLTQSSIIMAGKRLANQINRTLDGCENQYRISFVGHSMGGIIIRSAIPDLKECYRANLYTYISFSSPHLGYLYQSSALIRAGLWFLNTWRKIQALQQISMKDNQNLRQTVLYSLSKNYSLKNFKKLCFVCSSLDQYVVYESARVQQNEKLMTETLDPHAQQVIKQMVDGIIGQVECSEISRINVVFNIQDKNLDSFIGRTGHIKFLSDIQFIREFSSCFDKFFA